MASTAEHYERHLAPVYLWMAGGFEAALARGGAEVDALFPSLASGTTAIDLGAGFGMHAIALARRGCSVLAVDTSATLLEALRSQADALPITTVRDDVLRLREHVSAPVDVILCMGDTLTHLPEVDAVSSLFAMVAQSLRPGGTFVASFRDYSSALQGTERFIPVRSDAERILTCYLEYSADHVTVHDVLHERSGPTWQLRVSAYQKLRLSPTWVADALGGVGLSVRLEAGLAGMVRAVATAPERSNA
jgi:2-polyprenyl-3-methyl-5-hydroxy-6-metoxy-1,4-benzoquinol methylase